MNARYLKYLKCYCDKSRLKMFGYGNSGLYTVDVEKEVVETGVLACISCKRWFPVEDGILIMLPDNLVENDKIAFLNRYGNVNIADICDMKKMNVPINRKINTTKEDNLKKEEMDKRDEQAENYHNYGSEAHDIMERRHFSRIITPNHEDVVIELGCGTGRITQDFAKKVGDYIAIDFSRESLMLLKKQIKENILLMKADVCNLPIKNKIAKNIISAQVFEHIPGIKEQQNFVKEIKRVSKAGTISALTLYNYNIGKRLRIKTKKKGFHSNKIYYENFTRKEVINHFKYLFEIIELRGINCYLPKVSKVIGKRLHMKIENFLSKTSANELLGDIWLLTIRNKIETP